MTSIAATDRFIPLNDGHHIPPLGLGVWQIPDTQARTLVGHALKAGYRCLDTAATYGNEGGVGAAIADSALERRDVFLTTKVWNTEQGYDSTLRAFDASLSRLGTGYVDLYLIHWPLAREDKYVATFRALIELQQRGVAKSIGVSNFTCAHLQRLIDETGVTPAINQIELHPRLNQIELREFHRTHGIVTQAWSPLGQGQTLAEPVIKEIAHQHQRTPAQVILRWHLQIGTMPLPKSATPERVLSNTKIFDFELDPADMDSIRALNSGARIGSDPDIMW